MSTEGIISRVRINEIWTALGGTPPRHGRAAAFWRDGDGLNVSLNDEKNCWYDHARSEGGGVLALIQHAKEYDRKEALKWLADYLGVPLDDRQWTDAERREWGRRRAVAEAEARELVWWRNDLLTALREYRDQFQHAYHSARQFLASHSVDDCEARGDWRWEVAFDSMYSMWPKVEELDRRIELLRNARWENLLPYFRASRQRKAT